MCFVCILDNLPKPNMPLMSEPLPPAKVVAGEWTVLPLRPYFHDPDGDELGFRVSGLPAGTGFEFDSDLGAMFGTPSVVDALASPLELTVTVDDGYTSAEQAFVVLVSSGTQLANHPPVALPIPDAEAILGELFVFDTKASFSDSDGDSLTFEVEGLVSLCMPLCVLCVFCAVLCLSLFEFVRGSMTLGLVLTADPPPRRRCVE